ncbi:hypothetical protein BDZ97DRAFT_1156830 [Flammula alnicola]|nr:hypothetical protein BDZ97DRAFT_1156830 [Flammula alnicola]
MVTQVIEVGRLRLLARKSRSTCWWTRRAVSTQDWANSQERRTIRHSVLTEDDLTHSPPAYELDFDHRSVDGQFREPSHRPRHSAQECKDQPSFTDGIRIGRRMQEEEDSLILSQYRSRLRSAQTKHREALVRLQVKYRSEVEILERELAGMRDRLMATQMAYEQLAMTCRACPIR